MPLMKYLERKKSNGRRRRRRGSQKQITMSKTRELGSAIGKTINYVEKKLRITYPNFHCLSLILKYQRTR